MNEKFVDFIENNKKVVLGVGIFVLMLPIFILLLRPEEKKEENTNNIYNNSSVTQSSSSVSTKVSEREDIKEDSLVENENPPAVSEEGYSSHKEALSELSSKYKKSKDESVREEVVKNLNDTFTYYRSLNSEHEVDIVSNNKFLSSSFYDQETLVKLIDDLEFNLDESSVEHYTKDNEYYIVFFRIYDSKNDLTYKTIYTKSNQQFEIVKIYGSLGNIFGGP